MKDLIRLVLLVIKLVASVFDTVADVVIKIFSPISRSGHVVEDWCDRCRDKLAQPKKKKIEVVEAELVS